MFAAATIILASVEMPLCMAAGEHVRQEPELASALGAAIGSVMRDTQAQQTQVLNALASRHDTSKSVLRGKTDIAIPKGDKHCLQHLGRWFKEFDRVMSHLVNGGSMKPSEKVVFL